MITVPLSSSLPLPSLAACCKERLIFMIVEQHGDFFYDITITVPADLVTHFFNEAINRQTVKLSQTNAEPVLKEYVIVSYNQSLIEYTKVFLLKFCVLDFLYEQLLYYKIITCQDPQLVSIELENNKEAVFTFSINTFPPISLLDWKYFAFKMPKRKNYKDIDKQVDLFIKEENEKQILTQPDQVGMFDWVYFAATTYDGLFTADFWIEMADEEIGTPLRELFLGKSKGETFITHNNGIEEYLSNGIIIGCPFIITIKDIIPHNFFCLHLFKSFFKLKSQKDVHKKLIEIFSYRNDISQRRSIVEEALQLMRNKHPLEIPEHLIIRQKKCILEIVQKNPDYNVYKRQNTFETYLNQLARKQSEEILLIDQIAYKEGLTVSHEDIKGYLNLRKRNKTKEFLYFPFPESFKNGQATPLPIGHLKQSCLREKTINHIIYHFAKK